MADTVIFAGYSAVAWGTKPAGAHIVANIFRDIGLSAVVVDHAFAIPPVYMDKILSRYVDKNTKFVCLSTTLLGIPGNIWTRLSECDILFEPIMNKIRSLAPNAVFIIGGSKITRGEKTRLPFDYQVKGQGENCIKAIIGHEMFDHKLILDDEGYVSDKIYAYNEFNESSLLQFTEFDGVTSTETLPIEFARGCVFKCAFCEYNMTGKNFGDYTKTKEVLYRILMTNYEKFGTTRYQISDDTLNDSEEKINLILHVSSKLPFNLEFGAYLRAELLEKYPDSAQKLFDAGLRGANFGLETLNKKSGLTVGKGYGMQAVKTLSNARKVWGKEVAVNANIIIGLPFDSHNDIWEQQKIFTENDFLDNVFYTCLGIPKVGDSLFSAGLYKKYYSTLDQIPNTISKQVLNERSTKEFFEESVLWQNSEMNIAEALLLERELTNDFMLKKPFIINNVNAFCSVSLLEHYTMHQLRSLEYIEEGNNFLNIATVKVRKTIDFLLSNQNIFDNQPVNKIDKIEPSQDVFQSKIKYKKPLFKIQTNI